MREKTKRIYNFEILLGVMQHKMICCNRRLKESINYDDKCYCLGCSLMCLSS
jgi:hypothetical protein